MDMDKKVNVMREAGHKYIRTSKGYVIVDETRESMRKKQSHKPFMNPKRYVLVMLLLLMIVAQINAADHIGLVHAGIAVVTAIFIDTVLYMPKKRKFVFPEGAAITGLIVALVLSPMVSSYISALTAAIAIASKHLFTVKKKPVFNPAAFGLLVTAVLFSSGQNWWGGLSMLPVWCIMFVCIAGFFVTKKVNKFPQIFSFLGVYFLILLIMGIVGIEHVGDMLRFPYINSTLFLAFLMLTDPPTSLGKYKDQIIFGVIVAVASIVSYMIFGGLVFLLVGILVANGWKAWKISRNKKTIGASATSTAI
ncbi:RnfABCDGE type electron transport complex subunit D [Bacillus mycoides]|uniref:RnfABCDGE type electron transport complex subunit D n=1 Tax=Bacillus mycoides TaxID=1405 RepID=UPI00259FEEE6|nr:RnfABCDGE type electron transport complex subunit D [Bacillus mycoides]MDM5428106.1 RnfABCDGE type electron transport complex subunit D [Bacillus mycoides]